MTSSIMEEGDTGEALLPGLERELSTYLAADRAEPIVDPNMAGLNYGVVGDFSAITAEPITCPACGNYRDTPNHELGCTLGRQSAPDADRVSKWALAIREDAGLSLSWGVVPEKTLALADSERADDKARIAELEADYAREAAAFARHRDDWIEKAEGLVRDLARAEDRVDETRDFWMKATAKAHARREVAERALADERAKVADYESRITWHTTCKHCAETTDFAYNQTVRAEKAEAKVVRVEAKRDEFQRTAKERYAARQYEAASIYTTAHQGITFALAEPDDDAPAETGEVS